MVKIGKLFGKKCIKVSRATMCKEYGLTSEVENSEEQLYEVDLHMCQVGTIGYIHAGRISVQRV